GGDGIVYSEASAAIDAERRLRALAAGSRAQAFRVELADSIASALVGPGARRLVELEALTKKRFFLAGKPQVELDHFVVVGEGKLADLAPQAPVAEGKETTLQLVEVDRYDAAAAVGKLDGLDVVVADAASLVGKRVRVRIERVLDGRAYAVALRKTKEVPQPLTAEAEAEKLTRKPPTRRLVPEPEPAAASPDGEAGEASAGGETVAETEPEPAAPEVTGAEPEGEDGKPKRRTRRGSRGGRRRRKTTAPAEAEVAAEQELEAGGASETAPAPPRAVTIHVPGERLGREDAIEEVALQPQPARTQPEASGPEAPAGELGDGGEGGPAGESGEEPKPKRRTRRGSRGGRRRRKRAAAVNGAQADAEPVEAAAEPASANGEWEYVPMADWLDEVEPR
ncbi:MAG TPA: hypothetical protein VE995_02440, partial [Gaiellaceae bacterium]|nr:hypothetical protein [Gaiellaceae bacterium]